jgi:hypothetical protein
MSFIVGLWRIAKLFKDSVGTIYRQMYPRPPTSIPELTEQNFPETWVAYSSNMARMAQAGGDFLIDFFWLPPMAVGNFLSDPRQQITEQMVEPVVRVNTNIIVGWQFLTRLEEVAGQVERQVRILENPLEVKALE